MHSHALTLSHSPMHFGHKHARIHALHACIYTRTLSHTMHTCAPLIHMHPPIHMHSYTYSTYTHALARTCTYISRMHIRTHALRTHSRTLHVGFLHSPYAYTLTRVCIHSTYTSTQRMHIQIHIHVHINIQIHGRKLYIHHALQIYDFQDLGVNVSFRYSHK